MRLCACGCGQVTEIARQNSKKFGFKAGEHRLFLRGHSQIKWRPPLTAEAPLCACGCMRPVGRYSRTTAKLGAIKGNFFKYHIGHVARKSSVVFVVEWRGYTSACWAWKMNKTAAGYGLKGSTLAHKHYWQRINGPVPKGMELDHLCSSKDCIRPDHLEAVDHGENMRRAFARKRQAAANVQSA